MPISHPPRITVCAKLALVALALSACAAPAAISPTAVPTQPPATDTAPPPTAAATARSTAAPANLPVPATSILIDGPTDFAFDSDNNYYFSQCGFFQESVIYRIDPFG